METYDYRVSEETIMEAEWDRLNPVERRKLDEALKQIQLEHMNEKLKRHMLWFDNTIVPILKDFAELSSSELVIDKKADALAIATFRNSYGFDIMESDRWWRMALAAAGHIGIDTEGGETVLTLTFDCEA
jgi:hypothetical protein